MVHDVSRNGHAVATELRRLEAAEARLEADRKELARREAALRRARQRLRLKVLVGVRDGVRSSCRYPAGTQGACLNDRLGTLVRMCRTRAVVDFGDVGGDTRHWRMPLTAIIPAGQEQGQFIPLAGLLGQRS
jgi:hypothetical protein